MCSDYRKFINDGFLVKESLISPQVCKTLFGEIVQTWKKTTNFDYIINADLRIHAPLELSKISTLVLETILQEYYPVLNLFLPEPKMRYLAEFSSICVFPGAGPQNLHRDQTFKDRKRITIFVNLFDVEERSGPLIVVPQSHRRWEDSLEDQEEESFDKISQKLSLVAGSSVLMDSRLLHLGSENITASTIRPVFYVSFGEVDIKGPVYSLLPDYNQKYTLDDCKYSNFIYNV